MENNLTLNISRIANIKSKMNFYMRLRQGKFFLKFFLTNFCPHFLEENIRHEAPRVGEDVERREAL